MIANKLILVYANHTNACPRSQDIDSLCTQPNGSLNKLNVSIFMHNSNNTSRIKILNL